MALFSTFLGYSKSENVYRDFSYPSFNVPGDSTKSDTTKKKFDKYVKTDRPTYKEQDRYEDQFSAPSNNSSLNAGMPSNINFNFNPDDSLKTYEISETIGDDLYYRTPTTMTFEQFQEYQKQQQIKSYWSQINTGEEGGDLGDDRLIPKIALNPGLDRIFGGNFIDIRPNGSVTLQFGGKWQRTFNPALPKQQQRYGFFDFDQNITLNLNGSVGEKMKITMNWNTGAQFDFQNNIKLDYTGFDHEIIQDIDAGNISMPLPTQFITAGQNLFGIKTELKFGRLFWTTAISTQRGTQDEIEVENGAQNRRFDIKASDYEDNRHFFLGQYFRNKYEQAFTIPNLVSEVQVTRVEVYVLNLTQRTEDLRNVAAFLDLGETDPYKSQFGGGGEVARNSANTLYSTISRDARARDLDEIDNLLVGELNLVGSQDFEVKGGMRKLELGNDFNFHPQLGYISLNSRLQNNEVLAVSYEYSVNGNNYKVGELSEDYQNFNQEDLIILKLLRPSSINTTLPTWDLMMKNVYSLGTSQVNQDNFKMRIIYKDDRTGVDNPSLVDDCPIKDVPLVRVMEMDKINQNGDRQPDANFDFVDKGSGSGDNSFYPVTIDARRGRIYFPVLEPFGEHLKKNLGGNPTLERKYVYNKLYNGTKNDAQQEANKDKFILSGSFQSASSNEIMLNAISVEEGSVKVSAGSTPLIEGVDYTVNYQLGRVKILNQGILNSGKKIKISFEKQNLLNFRPRTLIANRWDYKFSDDFVIGATLLRLTERPFWNKIQTGDEPINNIIWGTDINYSTESRFLTKMVDKIPLINTKEISTISASGEFAQIIPGHAKGIEVDEGSEEGVAYIDDFEGTESSYLLSGNVATAQQWKLASTPVRFKEQTTSSLEYSKNRAKLAWYTIDRGFYFGFAGAKPELEDKELENDYVKRIFVQDVFPGRSQNQVDNQMYTLDFAYFPDERGQYNYDTENIVETTGKFDNPRDRWAGVMRANQYDVDFDNANVEYVEFWLLDPFKGEFNVEDDNGNLQALQNKSGGKLYIDLGSVSEDVMKDNRFAFENGIPIDGDPEKVEETDWGLVTKLTHLTNGFDNTPGTRSKQDIGLDGLNSSKEAEYFQNYLDNLPPTVKAKEQSDPSNDDFKYFLSDDFNERKTPVIQRYKDFNNMERNSPEGNDGDNGAAQGYTIVPDKEDLDNDNTLSTAESYYEYEVDVRPGMNVGDGYIVDKSPDGNWYQFRIPIRDPNGRTNVNNIDGFKSIRFLRMYLTGWKEPVVLRMAQFQYVEAQWRRVVEDLSEDKIGSVGTPENTFFNISSVNIEENGGGGADDIPYNLPPGVERQQNYAQVGGQTTLQNEQSLNLCVEDLKAGDARGVFKNTSFDFINYSNLRMFIHAHSEEALDKEVTAFIRVGIDKQLNYYEYEIPLTMTPFGTGPEDLDGLWPEENRMDVPIKDLIELKQKRGLNYNYDSIYTVTDAQGRKMKIKGNPDMSEVNIIMLGIRNPGTGKDINGNVIGDPKAVCVWFNELRMNGFNEKGGWAAMGNVNTRLADFATVNVSGSHTTIGFGPVHQTLNQRARENTTSYDVNSTVLLNKFLPTTWNIQLPMYVGYDKTSIAPKFDPLKPDVELKSSIDNIRQNQGADEANEYKRLTQDITTRKSINFTNVKKNRSPDAKIKTPLDISNFAVSYAYTEQERVNVNTEQDLEKRRTGTLNYGYSPKGLSLEPFKSLKPAYLQIIKDINFNPVPNNFTFRAELNRYYNEQQLRTIDPFNSAAFPTSEGIDPNFDKKINFRRQYSFRWNLTKSLSFDYTANVNAMVDERAGRISKEDDDYEEKFDVIKDNLVKFGRTSNFDQNATLNYKLPIDKFPILDWTSANASYKSNYSWSAGPVTIDDNGFATPDSLGNTIQNGNTKTLNGALNFEKLYNKSKYLKSINSPRKARTTRATRSNSKEEEEEEEKKDMKGLKAGIRSLMMIRSFNYNLSYTEGTMLPGYLGGIKYFGMDEGFNYPGYPFILGMQNDSIHRDLANEDMISKSFFFNQPMSYSKGFNGSYKLTVEPFDDFKINLDAKHNWNNSSNFIYKDTLRTEADVQFAALNAMNTGTFSTSYIAVQTFFVGEKQRKEEGDSSFYSPVFEEFIANRELIQGQLNEYNQNDIDTTTYGINSQDVLIPAFLKTYSGQDMNSFDPKEGEKNVFPRIPLPNWTVSYRGLSKVKFFKKWFTSVNLTHGYSGTYSVSGYNTSLEYSKAGKERFTGENYYNHDIDGIDNINIANDVNNEYIPYYLITQVTIQERMSPVIGIDVRTKSKMSFKVSYDKTRNMSLSMTNSQVTEMRSDKINFSYGFSKKGLELGGPFKYLNKAEPIVFPNEMNFKVGFSLTDNTTYQRFLEDGRSETTAGSYSVQINPTIDYDISRRLNIQLYFRRTINIPKISTAFQRNTTEVGGQIKFNLN